MHYESDRDLKISVFEEIQVDLKNYLFIDNYAVFL
jgi:hypothetical protein